MNEEEYQQEQKRDLVVPAEICELECLALEESNQSRSADAALLMLDVLLSHAQDLLRYASPEFRDQKQAAMRRLRNACQGMEHALVPLYVTGSDNKMLPVVEYEDESEFIHTDEHPNCDDPTCPCNAGLPPEGGATMMQPCDGWPAVTSTTPGCGRDRQLHVTVVEAITASHIFTLVFPGKAVAVLHIHGLLNQDEARAHASSVLPDSSYEVRDGDETHGHVAPFHAWTDAAAQETLSLQKAQEVEEIRCLVANVQIGMSHQDQKCEEGTL